MALVLVVDNLLFLIILALHFKITLDQRFPTFLLVEHFKSFLILLDALTFLQCSQKIRPNLSTPIFFHSNVDNDESPLDCIRPSTIYSRMKRNTCKYCFRNWKELGNRVDNNQLRNQDWCIPRWLMGLNQIVTFVLLQKSVASMVKRQSAQMMEHRPICFIGADLALRTHLKIFRVHCGH